MSDITAPDVSIALDKEVIKFKHTDGVYTQRTTIGFVRKFNVENKDTYIVFDVTYDRIIECVDDVDIKEAIRERLKYIEYRFLYQIDNQINRVALTMLTYKIFRTTTNLDKLHEVTSEEVGIEVTFEDSRMCINLTYKGIPNIDAPTSKPLDFGDKFWTNK